MTDMLAAMNRLRSLFYRENGTTSGGSSWGAGGASDAGRSKRYAAAINKGLTPEEARRAANGMPGGTAGVRVDSGSAPDDKKLLRWAYASSSPEVRKVLGAMQRSAGMRNNATRSRGGKGNVSNNALDRLLAAAQEEYDKYVNSVEGRYEEGKGLLQDREKAAVEELTNLRDRTTEKLSGYGDAQRKKLEQDFQEQLRNTTNNLRAAGLASISGAYENRNAFDLGLAKGLLDDRIVDREISNDASITGNLVDTKARLAGDTVSFIERRTDVPPNYDQLAQLAMQFGLGNGGRGFNNAPMGGTVGGYGGGGGRPVQGMAPTFMSPAQLGIPGWALMGGRPAMPQSNTSNRYPSKPRGPSRQAVARRGNQTAGSVGAAAAAAMGMGNPYAAAMLGNIFGGLNQPR